MNFLIIYFLLTFIPMSMMSKVCTKENYYKTENIHNNFQDAFCFIFAPQTYIYNECKNNKLNELGCRLPVTLFTIIFLPYGLIYFLLWILIFMTKQFVGWYKEIFREE